MITKPAIHKNPLAPLMAIFVQQCKPVPILLFRVPVLQEPTVLVSGPMENAIDTLNVLISHFRLTLNAMQFKLNAPLMESIVLPLPVALKLQRSAASLESKVDLLFSAYGLQLIIFCHQIINVLNILHAQMLNKLLIQIVSIIQ